MRQLRLLKRLGRFEPDCLARGVAKCIPKLIWRVFEFGQRLE